MPATQGQAPEVPIPAIQDAVPIPEMNGPAFYPEYDDCACQDVCGIQTDCLGSHHGVFFNGEATFFRYHRADGMLVQGVPGDVVEYGFQASPRLTIGYGAADGLGVRARWWQYDHEERSSGGNDFSVDTYNIDFEVFQEICLNYCTTLELFAGIRYNEFEEFQGSQTGTDRKHLQRIWRRLRGRERRGVASATAVVTHASANRS